MAGNAVNRQLEIGPGRFPLGKPWETMDAVPGPNVQHVGKWGAEPLPFDDDTFVSVYASHVLEHIPWFNTVAALREVHRILRSDGTLELWVPDFAYLVASYYQGRCGDSWRKHNPANDPMIWLNGRIFTYGPRDPNWHRCVFDEQFLRLQLERAGFREARRLTKRALGKSHGHIDLGMRAWK